MAIPLAAQAAPVAPVPGPPAGARPYERGPHDTAVLACLDAVTPALRPIFGRLDFARFIVPGSLSWEEVAARYGATLRPAGWTAEPVPERQAGCRLRAWSKGDAHVAAVLSDEVFEGSFRVLAVATPAR